MVFFIVIMNSSCIPLTYNTYDTKKNVVISLNKGAVGSFRFEYAVDKSNTILLHTHRQHKCEGLSNYLKSLMYLTFFNGLLFKTDKEIYQLNSKFTENSMFLYYLYFSRILCPRI